MTGWCKPIAAATRCEILAPFTERQDASIHTLTAGANALKSLRRYDEAEHACTRRAGDAAPGNAVAEYNLASLYGDMHRYAESESGVRRAMAMGLGAPEAWLVQARALQGLGQLDEKPRPTFRAAIQRRSQFTDAHLDLAQLVWMRTEDAALASVTLDAAIEEAEGCPA